MRNIDVYNLLMYITYLKLIEERGKREFRRWQIGRVQDMKVLIVTLKNKKDIF